jgi:PAS domain S-box-containing protein
MSGPDETKFSSLQQQCRQLQAQLSVQDRELSLQRARFANYEAALRGSHVTIFTQDADLRYTSVSNPIFGQSVETILGRMDDEILPAESRASIVAAKREVLLSGQPKRLEVAISEGPGVRWHDLHVEPLRDEDGAVIGLTGASVDVTERKEGEAHLRLLLRELTHRSKNLLAVIQAMARQTARHAGSINGFLDQFGSRLQALAASHDLLVRESWYGASLHELIRSQCAAYVDHEERLACQGPEVALKPEAAQSLGLALHELVINAAKFGALSVPEGRITISWGHQQAGEDKAIAVDWREKFGPRVKARRKQGFGSMMIERNLARALDTEVSLAFEPDGLHCHILIPASQILSER